MKPNERYKWFIVAVVGILFSTGILWKWYDVTASGSGVINQKSFLLSVHGAAAFVFLLCIGSIVSTHVIPFLDSPVKKKRRSGIITVCLFAILIVSAYLLYYGSMATRDFASQAHFWVGVLVVLSVPFHFKK